MIYVNSVLAEDDYGFIRIGGDGLANCMLTAARGVVLAEKLNAVMLRPTWERIGIGQWIRHEKDKRFYFGLFKKDVARGGLRKVWILATNRVYTEHETDCVTKGVVKVASLGGYFSDLWPRADLVKKYFAENIRPQAIASVPSSMQDCVAVHVRLCDNPEKWRTGLDWYRAVIANIKAINKNLKVLVFSDGKEQEIAPLLTIPGVRRAYYGNALADMIAMSRCRLLLGADSTFSGWATFLGDVPCVFSHLHYNASLPDREKCLVGESMENIRVWMKFLKDA